MYKVLICSRSFGKIAKDGVELLKKNHCELIENPFHRVLKEDDLISLIPGVDGLITGIEEVTGKVLEAADRLKVVSKHGVGVDNIDVDAATKRGIVVTYTPATGKEAEAVADFTFSLIFSLARGICLADQSVKSGGWERVMGADIWGKVLGVVGTGNIGGSVIKRASGFDMRILAYDARKDEELIHKFGVLYVSLEELLRGSDFITLHIPLNEKTKGLIGESEIRLMKRSAYLINAARGEIVDEEALFRCLSERRIAGAAVDVFSQEPPKKSPLLRLDNIITTPHIAAYTPDSIREIDLVTAQNTLKVLNNERPPDRCIANPSVYRRKGF